MSKRRWPWVAIGCAATLLVVVACTVVVAFAVTVSGGNGLGLGRPAVGIVRVEGTVVSGGGDSSLLASSQARSDRVVQDLRRAARDPAVGAIVLRINSPGGSVVASDEIHQAVLEVDKPVVASMGEVAASGGYYIAAAADRIVANPATLTGSIGVITMVPNVEELLSKIGVEMIVIKSGALKDELSSYREITEEEKQLWQKVIDEAYEQFVGVVADGRGMDMNEVKALADGRVYTGRQALELGLVDELGNLPDAIALAADLGGIVGKPRIIEYRRPPTLLELLLSSLAGGPGNVTLDEFLGVERRFSLQYLWVEP